MARPDSWFRFYNAVLDNPKVQRLGDALFKAWVNFLCLASKNAGRVDPAVVDFALRTKDGVATSWLKTLADYRLFDLNDDGTYTPHDWNDLQFKSDVSTDRVKRYRERHVKRDETVSCNEIETAQEKNIEEQRREDTDSNESVGARAPKRPKGTRLDPAWKPDDRDYAYGAEHGLLPAEIDAEASEFRDYFHGADAREPVKRDWRAAFRRWVRQNARKRIAGRARWAARKPPATELELRSAILASAGLGELASGGAASQFDLAESNPPGDSQPRTRFSPRGREELRRGDGEAFGLGRGVQHPRPEPNEDVCDLPGDVIETSGGLADVVDHPSAGDVEMGQPPSAAGRPSRVGVSRTQRAPDNAGEGESRQAEKAGAERPAEGKTNLDCGRTSEAEDAFPDIPSFMKRTAA